MSLRSSNQSDKNRSKGIILFDFPIFISTSRNLIGYEKVVAVGEIGLDYYWDEPDRKIQKKWFERQLDLAIEINKPVIIHSRDAAKDTYDILVKKNAAQTGGVIHCYSYSADMAIEYIKMGFYIGVGGVVTFKNGKKLKETVEAIPLEKIVLETDCPYLAPEPNRGKRNSSLNLSYIAREIANIKNLEYEEVIEATSNNAKRLYKLVSTNRSNIYKNFFMYYNHFVK